MSRTRRVTTVVLGLLLAVALAGPPAGAAPPTTDDSDRIYRVHGIATAEQRTALAAAGLEVLAAGPGYVEVLAEPAQARELRSTGLRLVELPLLDLLPRLGPGEFPPGFTGYHDYAEVLDELARLQAAHPDLVDLSEYGTSVEGRSLPLVKISDAVAADEDEPEVLFTCGQHAREHLTVEMCLHIADRLTSGHGTDPAITELVDGREVWLMPMTNPDGAEHDIATGAFAMWRKNRQPDPGSAAVGTDLNRNWGHNWGCCNGSSGSPGDDTYRGTGPFSAPETAQIRDWVDSRVVDGVQQIRAHIDWHTYSELILWPYGYTADDTAPGLDQNDAAAFRALGEAMARTNGYTPQQASDLYITDGSVDDWMWAEHRIYSYTFEMYPTSQAEGGFYPPDSVIDRETARNDAAVDLLLTHAPCVPEVAGLPC